MKKLIFVSFCLTILSLALFTSCEVNENNELVKNQLNEKQIVINEQAYVNLEKEFSKIRESLNKNSSSSDSEYAAAFFDIKLIDGEFAVSEVVYLTASEYGLAQGLSDRFNDQNTKSIRTSKGSASIEVTCEKTNEVTVCVKGTGFGAEMRQFKCVGKAIQSCFDNGGCATICELEVSMEK